MPVDMTALCADLADEHAALDALVSDLDEPGWDTLTPADPWTIRDQISHLAFFDEQATLAVTDPAAFAGSLEDIAADPAGLIEGPVVKGRAMAPREVLQWWREARQESLSAFKVLDPAVRVGWFGPLMSPASFISARIMETWAHGQDVEDAVAGNREPTDRLAHIALLGWRARPYSFDAHSLPMPSQPIKIDLVLPSGQRWEQGEEGGDRVSGPARDFCLVVTQRRHYEDTSLSIKGEAARAWLEIAQAFAGPPGTGRKPGQFPKE